MKYVHPFELGIKGYDITVSLMFSELGWSHVNDSQGSTIFPIPIIDVIIIAIVLSALDFSMIDFKGKSLGLSIISLINQTYLYFGHDMIIEDVLMGDF